MNERRIGLPHPSTVKCADMLQKKWDTAGNQPLPPGQGGRATPESVGIKDPGDGIRLIFIGDHGGIEDPAPQKAVAAALAEETVGSNPPAAIVSVGDAVYFYGDPGQYMPQFWQPYSVVKCPIVGVPGNHDGDPTDNLPGAGIVTWMANWCDPQGPRLPQGDPQGEFGRDTQTQPYCYWTLSLKAVTLIGLYSNVASGGMLDATQIAWLTGELKAAASGVPVIIYLHHPPYSVDAYHGGSVGMGADLDGCFEAAGRWADLVIAGHIHDQQSFLRARSGGSTRYLVVGNSGYHNLHAIAGDYTPGMQLQGGIFCEYAYADSYGYLKLTASGGKLAGEFVQVALDGTVTRNAYAFTQ